MYTLSGSPIVADLLCLTLAAFYAFTVANVLGYVLGPGPVTATSCTRRLPPTS
jgi:hypothetical protein